MTTEHKTAEEYEAELAALRAQAHETAEAAREAYDEKLDADLVDFDAFWSTQDKRRRRKRVRIFGQVIELPPALPLQFELEARRLAKSKNDDDVRKLVGILFGAEAFESWAEAGMDTDQFQVLLAWGPRAIAGLPDTLEQVAAELAEASGAVEDSDPS